MPLVLPSEPGIRTAFVELLLDDCYGLRPLAKRVEMQAIRILDIGANVGLFGVAARAHFPEATIHCYEPNATLERFLKSQARVAGFEYFLEAVGRDAGRATLLLDATESVQTSSFRDAEGSTPVVAFRTALDRLGSTVDLVKMDCEGAEWEILEDVPSWRRVRFLTLEYHLGPRDDHQRIVSTLNNVGFVVDRQITASGFGLVHARRSDQAPVSGRADLQSSTAQ